MTKQDIQLLYQYNHWANSRVMQSVLALSREQFTRDLGGSRSVRDILIHIIVGEWGWLTYWSEPSPSPASLGDVWTRLDVLFTPELFRDTETIRAKWAEIEEVQVEFVNTLTEESLERMLPFFTGQITLAQLMQHAANHSTYHRGQIALLMRQLGTKPLETDFHLFLLEGHCVS